MSTIYDKNKNLCGILVKGYDNPEIEQTDSALSGKYSQYINCNIFKNTDTDVGYYLPLTFNEKNFDSSKSSHYFCYYITNFSYDSIANNYETVDGTKCWFNFYNLMTWMNQHEKWNTLWSDDLLSRGYNYLSSYQGVYPEENYYICNANRAQDTFIKSNIQHNKEYYDVKYCYYNNAKKINNNIEELYITSSGVNTSSTDVTITSDKISRFRLGYNGILSGNGLTKYIESVDTTDSSGLPFWQRFFFVSIKGGFDASESYAVKTSKSNLKVCTFDQNTGLENENLSNLSSIPLKYKKLRNNVYLVQDNNFKIFNTYDSENQYIIKRDYHGVIQYYNGNLDSYDTHYWTTNIEESTHFSAINGPEWYNEIIAESQINNYNPTIIGASNNYKVKISLPMIMSASNANINLDRCIYITGNNGNVYTGTNITANYTTGHFNNDVLFCSGDWFSIDDSSSDNKLFFYNITEHNFTPYYNFATFLSNSEITDLLDNYKFILAKNQNEYWISGYDYSATYTNNISIAHKFNTSAEAENERQNFNDDIPSISIIDRNNNGFYKILNIQYPKATMFSSYAEASNLLNKMYDFGEAQTIGNVGIIDKETSSTNFFYNTKFSTNNTNNWSTSSNNLTEIPNTTWLSLNYFFTPLN